MYNLHAHSFFSDGVLLPSEVCVRHMSCGYRIIAITDHVDYSNIEFTVKAIIKFTQNWPKNSQIKVLPGVELTHLPPEQFKTLASYARDKGIKIIIAHGETIVEPVIKGTNRAALQADIDILAHPGLISDEDVWLAKKNGVFLEITSRHGHKDTNPHVAEKALACQAKLILNTDSHAPEDIIEPSQLKKVALSCGISEEEIGSIYRETEEFLRKIIKVK